jgi:hypothetical protein
VCCGVLPTGGVPVPVGGTTGAVGQGQDTGQSESKSQRKDPGAGDKTRRHGQVHGDLHADG